MTQPASNTPAANVITLPLKISVSVKNAGKNGITDRQRAADFSAVIVIVSRAENRQTKNGAAVTRKTLTLEEFKPLYGVLERDWSATEYRVNVKAPADADEDEVKAATLAKFGILGGEVSALTTEYSTPSEAERSEYADLTSKLSDPAALVDHLAAKVQAMNERAAERSQQRAAMNADPLSSGSLETVQIATA